MLQLHDVSSSCDRFSVTVHTFPDPLISHMHVHASSLQGSGAGPGQAAATVRACSALELAARPAPALLRGATFAVVQLPHTQHSPLHPQPRPPTPVTHASHQASAEVLVALATSSNKLGSCKGRGLLPCSRNTQLAFTSPVTCTMQGGGGIHTTLHQAECGRAAGRWVPTSTGTQVQHRQRRHRKQGAGGATG